MGLRGPAEKRVACASQKQAGDTFLTLYRINPLTGAATLDVVPAMSIGTPTAIDFNPAADRLRVFSGTSNFRVTPGTGVVEQ